MTFLIDVGLAFLFAAPILVSNAFPSLLGGGYPIDGYKNFRDGRRILGNHKTIQGFLAGLLGGFITGIVVYFIINDTLTHRYGDMGFRYPPLVIGLAMAWGCNFGDMFGSFIKRRINIRSGGSFPIFDQFGYIVFGLLWSWPFFVYIPWQFWITLLVIAPLLHIGFNVLGYFIKVKDVPW